MCTIGDASMRLYPRLGALALDSPERVKYFGLRSYRACGICRFRSGRSCARLGTRHNDNEISELYRQANDRNVIGRGQIQTRKRAREKLNRHGFKYHQQCELLRNAEHSLVHVEKYPCTLYGGLIQYERMHVFYINYCSYLLDILVKCVPQDQAETVAATVRQCNQFRDPITGVTHPRLPSVLKMTHMTAERRARAIFYWAHVMGKHANVIITPCRVHAQVAVSTLQLLLIATRQHRAYTLTELQTIFVDVGTQFFRSLERMSEILENIRIQKKTARHRLNPDRFAVPVPFKRTRM